MSANSAELARAREVVARALEALELDAYLFEIEPEKGGAWALKVECATDEGWSTIALSLPESPLPAADEREAFRRLCDALRPRLSACRRRRP